MTGTILDGKHASSHLREEIAKEIKAREKENIPAPSLAVVLIGNDPASAIYVENKRKACKVFFCYRESSGES